MKSWWDLGDWRGYQGNELALHAVVCPFCYERGNFSFAHHAEKKKPNARKVLHFDTLKCGDCVKGHPNGPLLSPTVEPCLYDAKPSLRQQL